MSTPEAIEQAITEVEHLSNELDLPQEVEQMAKVIVRRWAELNRLQSRPIAVNAAASIVVACKASNLPYTTRDVAARVSEEVDAKYIGRAETDMVSELGSALNLDVKVTTPEDYVDRFVKEIDLPESVGERALRVLEVAQEGDPNVFSGRSPSAGAAAAIWIGGRLEGEKVTQSNVSDVAESTNVTIRDMANSIIIAIFNSDTEIEELSATDEIDARLNQRIEKSRHQLEA